MRKSIRRYQTKIIAKNALFFVFLKNKFKSIFNLEEKIIKNILLFFLILFSTFFSFFAITTARRIDKISDIEIRTYHRQNNIELENKIKKITAGYPMNQMAYYISYQDTEVAAFMVAIAKKESNWGKRTPKLNGQECYNYWGFRKKRERMGSGGHTCFDNPKDAIRTVSNRIKNLLAQGVDTPNKMVLWKCGYNCNAQNPQSVKKWISDVGFYYNKF
ncbi:MAG TPA: hypothetical protein ENJ27_00375 [Candidatus Moranbacteria bacterium]|nr:hypothetical protein [Candidatus Moranbacteria bacterium]